MRPEPELVPGVVLPARLPRGFVLGEHMVDGWLRDGGMAAIYRAHRLADGQRVAVKVQLPSIAHDPSLGERFEREAEALWRIRGSAHVIELLDVGVLDDGRRYLVMEWVDGENLEELLDFLRDQDRQLPVARACRIARDVARGLAALHEHGVVHLDLKPSNVMIGRDDEVVLVDFGIAADLRELAVLADEAPSEALMGTSGYMSPQRARGRAPSPSCDVYALGVLLFEALSGGCVPPDGWSPETLPRVDALRHGVPPALSELVCMCMSVEAVRRPASAEAVATVLDAIIGALEAGATRTSSAVPLVGPGGTMVGLAPPVARAAPVRRRGNRVGAEAGLIAVEELPVPDLPESMRAMLRDAPEVGSEATWPGGIAVGPVATTRSGDTAVAPVIDPEDTEVGLPLVSVPGEPEDIEPTFELVPVPRVEPEDIEPTFELVPVSRAALEHGPPRARCSEVRAPARAEAPPQLEWLEKEPRWWFPWLFAAGLLATTAGVTVLLVNRSASGEPAASASAPPVEGHTDEPAEEVDEPSQSEAEAPPPEEGTVPEPRVETAEQSGSVIASKPSRRSSADSTERARRGHATAASEAACTEARAQADAAKRSRAWGSVLQATSQRRCWSSTELRVARARLRVTAYAELGELERCVEEGARIRDREIRARTALCRKKLGGG